MNKNSSKQSGAEHGAILILIYFNFYLRKSTQVVQEVTLILTAKLYT